MAARLSEGRRCAARARSAALALGTMIGAYAGGSPAEVRPPAAVEAAPRGDTDTSGAERAPSTPDETVADEHSGVVELTPAAVEVLAAVTRWRSVPAACPEVDRSDESSDEVWYECYTQRCVSTPDAGHEACIVQVSPDDSEGTQYTVAIRAGTTWTWAYEAFGVAAQPASLTFSDVDVDALRWVEADGGPYVELRWTATFTDADWCAGADGRATYVAFCGPAESGLVCYGALHTSSEVSVGSGRIDLEDDPDPAELAACEAEAAERVLLVDALNARTPTFDVTLDEHGQLVWTGDVPAPLGTLRRAEELYPLAASLVE